MEFSFNYYTLLRYILVFVINYKVLYASFYSTLLPVWSLETKRKEKKKKKYTTTIVIGDQGIV